MTSLAITDIGSLVTADPSLGDGALGIRTNAAMVVVDGKVEWVGDNGAAPDADRNVSVHGKTVIPGFVDSHAHFGFCR